MNNPLSRTIVLQQREFLFVLFVVCSVTSLYLDHTMTSVMDPRASTWQPIMSVDTQCFHPEQHHKSYYKQKIKYDIFLQRTSVCIHVVVRCGTEPCRAVVELFRGNSRGLASLRVSHLAEEDGAEQEDGVEEKQAQTQPAIQLPVVQVHARHLGAKRIRLAP